MLVIPEAFDQNNAEQMSALQCLEQTSMSLFLTGSAGTGKSYFVRSLSSWLRRDSLRSTFMVRRSTASSDYRSLR